MEKIITTQAELDALVKASVQKEEKVFIRGSGLKLNANLEVFGFLKIESIVEMDWYSARVEARGSSRVVARESSSVVAWESSSVEAWESSSVEAWGTAVSWIYSASATIHLFGWSISYRLFEGKGKIAKKSKTASIITVPPQKPTLADYEKRYPVIAKGTKFTFYKAVHKKADGTYFSDYDRSFTYEVGKVYQEKCAPTSDGACSKGLHVAFKSWARAYGISWSDFALIECQVEKKDIVVSADTDGKVRCSKLIVIREVPEAEYYA